MLREIRFRLCLMIDRFWEPQRRRQGCKPVGERRKSRMMNLLLRKKCSNSSVFFYYRANGHGIE